MCIINMTTGHIHCSNINWLTAPILCIIIILVEFAKDWCLTMVNVWFVVSFTMIFRCKRSKPIYNHLELNSCMHYQMVINIWWGWVGVGGKLIDKLDFFHLIVALKSYTLYYRSDKNIVHSRPVQVDIAIHLMWVRIAGEHWSHSSFKMCYTLTDVVHRLLDILIVAEAIPLSLCVSNKTAVSWWRHQMETFFA